MFSSKSLLPLLVLCIVHGSLSKPFTNNAIQGRGIGSTIWGWITYPFTWWSSDVSEILPEKDQLVDTDSVSSHHNIGTPNVIVQCNDQTCTTTRCDAHGCVNITCNIYDTDLTGQCRNYNTDFKPEEPTTSNCTDSLSKLPSQNINADATTTAPIIFSTVVSQTLFNKNVTATEERPLELEAVLSSTVTESVDAEVASDGSISLLNKTP